jgi:t-SNARE complex subunit (syntaxin)
MAVLVETQGELLNQIEFNVGQSVAYTEKGVEELKQAVVLQKKSRRVRASVCQEG